MLLRGNNRREIELADLYLLPLENEGPTKCKVLVILLCNGKTNQHGRVDHAGAMRNQEVLVEPFPVLRSNDTWFDTKLFVQYAARKRATDRTTAIDYKNTQMKWTNRMFSEANILSTKKTHAGRKAGAQMAEIRGVGESEIRRAGRWNRDEMTSCYLTSLPFKCIKAMSGLSPKGDFYIARAQITPPLELQKKIFPTVDYWLARYYGQTEIDLAIEHQGSNSQNLETSIAGHGFLRLVEYLREVFFQDILFLRKLFKDLPLWHHELFSEPLFVEWEKHFWELYREPDSERVVSTRLENVIPDVATTITSLHSGMATKIGASEPVHSMIHRHGGIAGPP
ncbi:hypothetical protein V1521DRAFT_458005 [Lipomyces starkeyi]